MGPPDHDSGRRLTQPTPATTPTTTQAPEIGTTIADDRGAVSVELPRTPPRGPDEHGRLARQLGLRSVTDLLVLSRQNDPFFKGTPAHWRDARWFAALWEHFEFDRGVHLRRVHYRAMTVGYPKLDGAPYANTEQDWKYLQAAGTAARILGLVDPEAFVDRRNTPPVRNVEPRLDDSVPERWWDLPGEEYLRSDVDDLRWSVPALNPDVLGWRANYRLPAPVVSGYDYQADDQSTLVEVWIEKSTMNDVLEPVCRNLNVNLLAGKGFQSLTAAIQLLRRAEQHGKPAHVCYISDFDPAGVVMPVSIARQAQFWAAQLGIEAEGIDAELTLHPVVLTRDQVDTYQLPRVPVALDKNGNPDRRGRNFEAVHGEGVVELDALEALHPGQLATLVRQAVHPYLDQDLARRLHDARRDAQGELDRAWREATSDLRVELGQVEAAIRDTVGRYQERLQVLADELAADLAPHQRTLDELADRTRQVAEGFDVELPDRPLADPPDVDRDRLLYDSSRDWWTQLRRFKAAQHGGQEQ
jgi:hypothetical protein